MTDKEKHPVLKLSDRAQKEVLLHGFAVFVLTGTLALAGVARIGPTGGYQPSAAVSVPYFLLLFFLATLTFLFILKSSKKGVLFEILFTIAILSGAWFLADLFLPESSALLLGSAVILLRFLWKNVLTQNLTLAVGIAGISVSVAAGLTVTAVLIVLTVLVFYDILAVYKTRHMVRMFRDLVSRGVLFAFALTPLKRAPLLGPATGPSAPRSALLLGTGDVALPAMLAVSAARAHVFHGAAVIIGAALGFAFMFRLFTTQKKREPMPALPPIALGAILGYLVSLFIFS